jgi:tol-pal system protein YbgF
MQLILQSFCNPNGPVLRSTLLALSLICLPGVGRAGLFEDEDARRAILELRKQNLGLTQQIAAGEQAANKLAERVTALETSLAADRDQSTQLRKLLLEFQVQLDASKGELAVVRGAQEVLQRDTADARKWQKAADDQVQGVGPKLVNFEVRLAKLEPVQVQINGVDVWVTQDERREFDAALVSFQAADYVRSQKLFTEFLASRPRSAYTTTAMLWLANAQYALRDFGMAMQSYRAFLTRDPGNAKAPEALLGVANCQLELKDIRGMKKSLEDLIRLYPQSDAAVASAGRLKAIK